MKNKKSWRLLPGIVLLALAVSASAQTGHIPAPNAVETVDPARDGLIYTVPTLIELILQSNPGLLGARRAREQAAAGVTIAGALLNPRIEYSQGRNDARVVSAVPGDVQNWTVSQFIENPSLRGARIDAARAAEAGSEHNVALVRAQLVSQVQLRAYEYFLRVEESRALTADVTLLEQVRERVRVRVESGEAARYEIIKADAEVINARQRQRNASLLAEQALLALNRLAAGQLPATWSLRGQLDGEVSFGELPEMQELARLKNPEIKVLESELERARRQLDSARSSRWPGLDLRYSQMAAPDVRQNMIGVQVQVPLFDQKRGRIEEASKEAERARIRLEGRQAELEQQILQAWTSLEMARLRVEALAQGVMREAEAALRVAQAAYRFGERGILDVLDAQRVLQSVRSDLLDARFAVQAARIELELLTGRYADEPR
jgi:cobalt-zinc-cadmium efflux system outer membrane protein